MLMCTASEDPEVLYFRMPLPQAADLAFCIHSPGSVHPILDNLCSFAKDVGKVMAKICAIESSTPDDSISIKLACITESQATGSVGHGANSRFNTNLFGTEQLNACANVDEVATTPLDEMSGQVRLRAVGHLKSGLGEARVPIAITYEHLEQNLPRGTLTALQPPVWHV